MQMVPLSPKYRQLNIGMSLGFGSLFSLLISLVWLQPWLNLPSWMNVAAPWILLAVLVFHIASAFYSLIADPLKMYALREQDISYQSGLVFRKITSQPILRIQHIELKRGPFERWCGLATLQVFSAGGAMHTFEIPGLEHDTAIALRQFMLDHADLSING